MTQGVEGVSEIESCNVDVCLCLYMALFYVCSFARVTSTQFDRKLNKAAKKQQLSRCHADMHVLKQNVRTNMEMKTK